MPCPRGSANNFGIVTLAVTLIVVLVLGTACDVDYRDRPHLATFSPIAEITPFITTSIFPTAIVVVPVFGFGCGLFPSLATNFDLVISVSGTSDLFLRETTFRLLDGTHHAPGTSAPTTTPVAAGVPVLGAGGSGGFADSSALSDSDARCGPRMRSIADWRSSSTSSASRP